MKTSRSGVSALLRDLTFWDTTPIGPSQIDHPDGIVQGRAAPRRRNCLLKGCDCPFQSRLSVATVLFVRLPQRGSPLGCLASWPGLSIHGEREDATTRAASPSPGTPAAASPAGRGRFAGRGSRFGRHVDCHIVVWINRWLSLHPGRQQDRPDRCHHSDLCRAKGGPSQTRIFKKIVLFSAGLLCPVQRDQTFAAADFLQFGVPQCVTSRPPA